MSSELIMKIITRVPWKPIFQRLPGVWLLLLIPFAILGPIFTPLLYGVYYITLHFLFLLNNCRSGYGMFIAYNSAKLFATTNWLAKYCKATGTRDGDDTAHDLPFNHIVHLIILPNYAEDMDTLFETLDVLASHSLALTQYKVCLAMEESEKGAENKAKTLIKLYSDSFFEITFTLHPKGRVGEIRGKSSNVAWAAAQMASKSGAGLRGRHDHEICTVMDADTCFAEDYFSSVTFNYCVASPEQRKIMMFAPCTVFDRNSNNVPIFVRVTDMFWSIGVMSNLYAGSSVKIPCSAYSVSMDLAIAVGFWDAGPEAIGEDLHMYLKCFFYTGGNVIVRSIFSPASQCNVEGSGFPGAAGYISALKARYTQAKRHLWGSLDTGYTLRRGIFNILVPEYEAKIHLKNTSDDKLGKDDDDAVNSFSITTFLSLFHRLLEAHVLMGQLFILIITSTIFLPVRSSYSYELSAYLWSFLSSYPVHPYVEYALNAAFWIRFACLIPNVAMISFYEKYHRFVGFERWALQDTEANVRKSLSSNLSVPSFQLSNVNSSNRGLKVHHLGKRPTLYSAREYPRNIADWFVIPVAGFLFYVLPQFHAQVSHLWTDSLEYIVAAKPQCNRQPQPTQASMSEELNNSLVIDVDNKSVASSKGDEGYYEEFDESVVSGSSGKGQ